MLSGEVTVVIDMTFENGGGDALAAKLHAMLEDTRQRRGFVGIVALRSDDDPDRFMLVETWADEDSLRDYVAWRVSRGEAVEGLRKPASVGHWARLAAF